MASRIVQPLRSAARNGEAAAAPKTLLARYRAAAQDLARAWGQPRRIDRSENLRVFESLGTLAVLAAIVGIGVTYDISVMRWAAQLTSETVEFFARITHFGASGYVFALTALVAPGAIAARHTGLGGRRDAALSAVAARGFFLFTVAAVSGLTSTVLKHLFGRARPKFFDIVGPLHFDGFTFDASFASFPSGHAVTAVAMAVGVGFVAPRWRWPLLVLAGLVMASRVIIGAHYLSDVLAGAFLGYASAALVRRAFAARSICFRAIPRATRLRGRGLVWRALGR